MFPHYSQNIPRKTKYLNTLGLGLGLMVLFGSQARKLAERMGSMESSIRASFDRVKEDLGNTGAWISYLSARSDSYADQFKSYEGRAAAMSNEILKCKNQGEDQSQFLSELLSASQKMVNQLVILEQYAESGISRDELNFHIEKISQELRRADAKIEEVSYMKATIDGIRSQLAKCASYDPTEVEKKVEAIQEKLRDIMIKKSPRDKLVEKVTRSSHDYVKAVVLSYVKKYGEISGFQLREMIVEEQNLTSKSTFYRILEEIEAVEDVSTIRKGKEKIYLAKASRFA